MINKQLKFLSLCTILALSSISLNASTLDWDDEDGGWEAGSLYRAYENVDGSGVDIIVKMTSDTDKFNSGAPDDGTDILEYSVDYDNTSQEITTTIQFSGSVTVSNLIFKDIDSGSWDDKIIVTGKDTLGNTIIPDNVNLGAHVVQLSDTSYESDGSGSLDNSDEDGWLTVSFTDTPITELTFQYTSGSHADDDPGTQVLDLSNIEFTPIDTDGDGIVDGSDIDSDNDGILDKDEGKYFHIGHADSYTQSGVDNPDNALGKPDGNVATMSEDDDSFVLDLTDTIEENKDIMLRLKGDSEPGRWGGDTNYTIRASIDSDNWIDIGEFTDTSGNLVTKTYKSPAGGARYIKFVKNDYTLDIDAITYDIISSNIPDDDNDSIANYLDLDSDNDGIPDNIEAQPTKDYITPSGTDSDGDGLDDAYDEDNGGTAVSLPDSDNDNTKDYLDTDSDNDGYSDCEEGNKNHDCSTINIVINGMPEWEANGADYSDINGNIDEPDPDKDGDLIDRISDNDEAAYRELLCGKSNFQLTKDQWRMISIPCDTGTNSIKTLFGGVLGDYDDNWVMYKQTGDDNYETNSSHKNTNKTKLTEDDTLTIGISYWIIADENHTLDINESLSGLSPTTTISKDSVSIDDDLFTLVHEVDLPANSAENIKKFMTGNPLPFRFDVSKLYFKNGSSDYYPMGDSNNSNYIVSDIYTHDSSDTSDKNISSGGGYRVISPSTPGLTEGQIVPMEGFFIKLEIQDDENSNKFAFPLMQQYAN